MNRDQKGKKALAKDPATAPGGSSTFTRCSCLICGGELSGEPVMRYSHMPSSAQNIPDADQVKGDRGIDLALFQCPKCGLVQFDCEPVDYYRDVIRSGGYSTTMVELRRSQYTKLLDRVPELTGKKILEAGCGQGEFLQVLTEFPVQGFGVEHKGDLVELAKAKGLLVSCGFPETKETILGENGKYDGFLSFNFLEHQPEPGVMLDCIYENLKEEAWGLVTVPSLEYILKYNGYYELIRDHIAYYSFETLTTVLGLHGFLVIEQELVNRDTCSVIVKKVTGAERRKLEADIRAKALDYGKRCQNARKVQAEQEQAEGPEAGQVQTEVQAEQAQAEGPAVRQAQTEVQAEQAQAEGPEAGQVQTAVQAADCPDFSGLAASQARITAEVSALEQKLEKEGKTLAIWGASHQGFTLAATTDLYKRAVYIMDSAPFKQGRFAPASHLPIVAPDHFLAEPVDAILIVAPGYTEEIAGIIKETYWPIRKAEIYTLRSNQLERLDTSQSEPAGDRKPEKPEPAGDRKPEKPEPAGDLRPEKPEPAGDRKPEKPEPAGDQKPEYKAAGNQKQENKAFDKKHRVVVTGGTGFIGRNLIARLLKAGYQVFAVVRPESKQLDRLPKDPSGALTVIRAGLEDYQAWTKEIGEADAFFHLAWGGVNRQEIDSKEVQERNVSASFDCIQAASLLNCNVFMDAGSRVEYGVTEEIMEESLPCSPVNEYGKAKLKFFRLAAPRCKEAGLSFYHLRFFSVYGVGDHPWSIISTLTAKLPAGEKVSLSACRHKWNFMEISDAVEAVYQLYLHAKPGDCEIVNIASADTRVLREFVEEIHSLSGNRGSLEFGSFKQAKEGALSIVPSIEKLKTFTAGDWEEKVSFAEGICRMLREQAKE